MTNQELRDYIADAMMKQIAHSWAVAEATGLAADDGEAAVEETEEA